jgi:hypothetical protein
LVRYFRWASKPRNPFHLDCDHHWRGLLIGKARSTAKHHYLRAFVGHARKLAPRHAFNSDCIAGARPLTA